jgi:hypothetical protein
VEENNWPNLSMTSDQNNNHMILLLLFASVL